jgi:hypothetical protein
MPSAPPRSELLFCAVCQVSISAGEIDRGEARRTPKGRAFCGVCASATPEERRRRREELEIEFADDAPIPPPIPHASSAARAQTAGDEAMLAARVGELERSAFRMDARVRDLEERLDAALRRLDGRGA